MSVAVEGYSGSVKLESHVSVHVTFLRVSGDDVAVCLVQYAGLHSCQHHSLISLGDGTEKNARVNIVGER